jgi:hypothetical protein
MNHLQVTSHYGLAPHGILVVANLARESTKRMLHHKFRLIRQNAVFSNVGDVSMVPAEFGHKMQLYIAFRTPQSTSPMPGDLTWLPKLAVLKV